MTDEERETLERSARRRKTSQALALWSRIVEHAGVGGPEGHDADGRQVAEAVHRTSPGWPGRRTLGRECHGRSAAPIWSEWRLKSRSLSPRTRHIGAAAAWPKPRVRVRYDRMRELHGDALRDQRALARLAPRPQARRPRRPHARPIRTAAPDQILVVRLSVKSPAPHGLLAVSRLRLVPLRLIKRQSSICQ